MQRYHDTGSDPLPVHSPQHEAERVNLARQTEEFLARGGKVQQVGFQMSSTPASFSINPERTPVYAHLFTPARPTPAPTALPLPARDTPAEQAEPQKHAALIIADAALGNSPRWIAKKHHMTEKYVRQIARTYHITFHKQR